MLISVNEALENEEWYPCDRNFNKFKVVSFNEINLDGLEVNSFIVESAAKEGWTFRLLKLDIVPVVSVCFHNSSSISKKISICDSDGNSYSARYDPPSYEPSGNYDILFLHKYDFSIKIPNCKCQASLLFHLPSSEDYTIIHKEPYIPLYKHTLNNELNNEIDLIEAVQSGSWYRCEFKQYPELDIRMQIISLEMSPLSQVVEATKDSQFYYTGYYNLDDCEFKTLKIKIVNNSKGDNDELGHFLSSRLMLLDDTGLYYSATGSAGGFYIYYTTSILGVNRLFQPLTPKIVYDVDVVFLVAKKLSLISLGLKDGTVIKI